MPEGGRQAAHLQSRLAADPLSGHSGIGHTRWATHGRPTERNAHPHATDRLAVVHNGIIETFRELRGELEADGVTFETETDTEVVAQLATRAMRRVNDPASAIASTLGQLRGAFALAFLFGGEDDLLIAARQGAPLRCRPWRGRDVSGIRCHRVGAADGQHHLP
jgi:glutamine---fructose-6-phosphate transaminase (isomerizing)